MDNEWVKDTKLNGLYRRRRKNTADWYVKARQKGGNPRSIKLGRCDVVGVSQARSLARKVLSDLAAGINPNTQRQQRIIEERKVKQLEAARNITLQQALEECFALKDYKPKSRQDMISMFQRNFSDWMAKSIRSITREDVLRRFAEIKTRVANRRNNTQKRRADLGLPTRRYKSADGQGEAQKAFRYLQTVINSFMNDEVGGEPILRANPCNVLKDKKVRSVLKPRDSFLDESPRAELLECLTKAVHPQYSGQITHSDADFVLLLLLTGLRVDEAKTLRWSNINFKEGWFKAENTKNHTDHTLPMTTSTEKLFSSRFKLIGESSEWVFPSPQDSSKHASMSRTVQRVVDESGVAFTPHDLRRTVATIASELGYDLAKISAVLNHAKTGVTAGYVQDTVGSLKRTLEDIEGMVLRSFEVPTSSSLD